MAHVFAWVLTHGPVPSGLYVCHNCPGADNKLCCNPAHLWLGTPLQNSRDAVAKGQTASGDRNGSRLHPESRPRGDDHAFRRHPELVPRGETHYARLRPAPRRVGEGNGRAKLREEDVREIRRLSAEGMPIRALAARFGVGKSMIAYIRQGKYWQHVD